MLEKKLCHTGCRLLLAGASGSGVWCAVVFSLVHLSVHNFPVLTPFPPIAPFRNLIRSPSWGSLHACLNDFPRLIYGAGRGCEW